MGAPNHPSPHAAARTPPVPPAGTQRAIPDLDPFAIDPLFLGRLDGRNFRAATVTVVAVVLVAVGSTYPSSVERNLYRASGPNSWSQDFTKFTLRRKTGDSSSVGFFSDYPSILLAITIAISIGLVYGLFRNAKRLHSSMEGMDCLSFTSAQSRDALIDAVEGLNARFSRVGKRAPLVAGACIVITLGMNISLKPGGLYRFEGGGSHYNDWWAGLSPFHWASLAWVIIGALGIYVVFAEAVLGLSYVSFLKACKDDYRFRANIYNPDQFFGWLVLRKLISNMEMGVVCTFLSCFAITYYFATPAAAALSGAALVAFAGVVMYVFAMVTLNFRRQVKNDKFIEARLIKSLIDLDAAAGTLEAELRISNRYKRLALLSAVPNNPIRAGWLVVGAATVFIPIVVVSVQIISYLAPPK